MQGSNFDLAPQDWATLRGLLDTALDLPAGEREAWVEQLDAQFAGLKPRLRALLAHAESAQVEALLNTLPKVETGQFAPLPKGAGEDALASQTLIGPYRLLRQLGEGGMAAVWLAERTDLLQSRKVALKLPHGAWRRAGLAERMAREREILATLEHPHIARLYDAGVADDGQPYLALEYVEGQRIDEYCSAHALNLRERLGLFLQVTKAVAYAHANLVVHRDLKPSNILVTIDGQVRLLDFGVAKLLDHRSSTQADLTQQLGAALTPDYAAPEQWRGESVGTAADVYSLGVVLYELLALQRPHRLPHPSRATLEAAFRHGDARRPSDVTDDPRLKRQLRGDLDTIVTKALKESPAERYATVNALGEDIERFLDQRPVLARPDSLGYRTRKFVRRHRLIAAAASLALLAVLTGTGAALWQAGEARAQRDVALLAKARADQEAAAARAAERNATAEADLSSFLLSDLTAGRPDEAMIEQLERALLMVRAQYRNDAALRGRMLLGIGQQFRWISEHARADAVLAEAEPLLRAQGDPGAWAQLLCIQASARARGGQPQEARLLLERAAQANPLVTNAQLWARAECLQEEALIARYAGDPAHAITLIEQAMGLAAQVGRGESEDYSEALNALARADLEAGRFADAAQSSRRSIALLERIGRDRTPGYLNAWGTLAQALRDGGRLLDAERAHRGNGRFDPAKDLALLTLRTHYAFTLVQLQWHDKSLPLLSRLIAQSLAEDNPTHARYVLLDQARALIDLGRVAEARKSLARAEPMFAAARANRQPQIRTMAFANAAWAIAAGQWDSARAALDEARAALERTPSTPRFVWRTLHQLDARLALARGDAVAARAAAEQALALSQGHAIDPEESFLVAEDLLLRAQARRALGDVAGARADARRAEAHARATAGAGHPVTRHADKLARA